VFLLDHAWKLWGGYLEPGSLPLCFGFSSNSTSSYLTPQANLFSFLKGFVKALMGRRFGKGRKESPSINFFTKPVSSVVIFFKPISEDTGSSTTASGGGVNGSAGIAGIHQAD